MPTHRAVVVVRNLPRLTSENDIETFFNTRIQKAAAHVFPLVNDTQNYSGHSKCTTVELAPGTMAKALSLNNHEFIPRAAGGGRSRIQIDASFIGAITLAEHTNPRFDLYFVHGVGGNALSSWVSEATGHMWPRDSFPIQCRSLDAQGRFSTLGYDAKVIDKGEPKTIQSAAESILKYIAADRPPNCQRPIFFVCHSLGGLVVTQALVLALAKPAIKPEYAFIQHMVKGVAYFGTPFQGSKNADILSPFASIVAGVTRANTSFVNDLKSYASNNLPDLMQHFNHIMAEEGIEVLLFVEKNKDGLSKVATRTSATLPFRTHIAPIEIDADHRGMVKFSSGNEARHSITEIVNMIKRQIGPAPETTTQTAGDPLYPVLDVPGLRGDDVHTDGNVGFSLLAKYDTVFVIDDTGSMQMPARSSDPEATDTVSRWNVLTRSLQYLADVAAKHDKNGVDVNFLISEELNDENIKSGQELLNIIEQVDLTAGGGGTYFEPVLAEILGPYVSRYSDYFENKKRGEKATKPKPLNIIVMTDGKDDDEDATEELLVNIAKQLDSINAPKNQVGIQFFQVGDDQAAAQYLDRLDNDLKTKYKVRDFVDTKNFRALETHEVTRSEDFANKVRHILLGAINDRLDKLSKF